MSSASDGTLEPRCHGFARSISSHGQALPVAKDSSVNAIYNGITSENANCSLAHLVHACGGASTRLTRRRRADLKARHGREGIAIAVALGFGLGEAHLGKLGVHFGLRDGR